MIFNEAEEQNLISLQKKLAKMMRIQNNDLNETEYNLTQIFNEVIKTKDKQKVYQLIYEKLNVKTLFENEEILNIFKNEHILFMISLAEKMNEEKCFDSKKCFSMLYSSIQLIQVAQSKAEVITIEIATVFEYIKCMEKQNEKSSHYLIVLVKKYVQKRLNCKIYIATMAEEIGTNASYISRLFHEKEGLTIQQYISSERMKQAKKLLCSSDYTNEEISRTLGFSSLSYFGKILKEHTGMTPNQYRLRERI
ncbi:MAG: helix-turn-helix domain-containing protein [Lachnotalea sp.]